MQQRVVFGFIYSAVARYAVDRRALARDMICGTQTVKTNLKLANFCVPPRDRKIQKVLAVIYGMFALAVIAFEFQSRDARGLPTLRQPAGLRSLLKRHSIYR